MSDGYDDSAPLLHSGPRGSASSRTFWACFLRLYRNNDTWRGAVDLIFLGSLVFFLAFGLKGFDDFVKNLFSFDQKPSSTQSSISSDNRDYDSAPIHANFGITDDNRNSEPVEPALPVPGKKERQLDPDNVDWVQPVSPADYDVLKAASALIGEDNQKVKELVEEKARAGNPNYQFLMGVLYVNEGLLGQSAPKQNSLQKPIYWYKESASQGHADAQYELGQIYRLGGPGVYPDITEAIKWYRMAINNPLNTKGKSENEMGRLYERGEKIPKNISLARELYLKGAKKGNAQAQSNYGALLGNDQTSIHDIKQIEYWTRQSAEQGNMMAQMNLAMIFYNGSLSGVPDYMEFIKWAGLSADQGFVPAMIALGDFYRDGKPDFPIDHKRAAHYYRLAALKKDPKAQYLFADMYAKGLGVPEDKIQAYVYYSLSYSVGKYEPAYKALNDLKESMSPAQLAHARSMFNAINEKE
ncbi:MAG: sel1 repeat family protein [Alphaproteobacteria bacterium]|nr:sel1 repeat family protein [Alphaproteobacteria bacterium]